MINVLVHSFCLSFGSFHQSSKNEGITTALSKVRSSHEFGTIDLKETKIDGFQIDRCWQINEHMNDTDFDGQFALLVAEENAFDSTFNWFHVLKF